MKQIILASTSPRRNELLSKTGLKFKAVKSGYEEDMALNLKPKKLVEFLSKNKALAVMKKYPKAIIISGDTIIAYKDKVLGKPKSKIEAKKFLKMLSGKSHEVITAFTIFDCQTKKTITKSIPTKITMKKLTDKEIDWYIKTGEPLDKAGAYAIQGLGAMFITKISGDYFATVGLPVYQLVQELKKFGIEIIT
ncbi:MAG TPA: septum formation inhibitor Maf [Candidatus Magasanikbacteria bacterium]|nr:septum formation inhibitor Maf [Candidatus Magasanikbacteria bacterium]